MTMDGDELYLPSDYADLPDFRATLEIMKATGKTPDRSVPPVQQDTLGQIENRVRAAIARMGPAEDPETERRLSLLAEVVGRSHVVVEDGWYSCAQAGDACYDDNRRGDPCDCGRDDEVRAVLLLLDSVIM